MAFPEHITLPMSRLLIFLLCFLFVEVGLAHPGHVDHLNDFKDILNGYWVPEFDELSPSINSGVDSDLCSAFEKKLGIVTSPRTHRIIGHGWTMGAPIRQDRLQKLLGMFPNCSKDEIMEIWAEWVEMKARHVQLLTGLPGPPPDPGMPLPGLPQGKQAQAMASFLHNIHCLGDLVPEDNKLIEDVLTPAEIVENMKKDVSVLCKNKPDLAEKFGERLDAVLEAHKGENPQMVAQHLMDELKTGEARPGVVIEECWGKTKAEHLGKLSALMPIRTAQRIGKNTSRKPSAKKIKLRKEEFFAGGKQIWRPALLTPGRLIVPVKEFGKSGVIVIALDSAIPTYQYATGKILKEEFVDRMEEAAIKGTSVGMCSAVAVLMGATPGGIIVFAVAVASYEIADLAIRVSRQGYLSAKTLEAFGVELDTAIDLPHDTIFEMETDSPLEGGNDTIYDIGNDTPLEMAK